MSVLRLKFASSVWKSTLRGKQPRKVSILSVLANSVFLKLLQQRLHNDQTHPGDAPQRQNDDMMSALGPGSMDLESYVLLNALEYMFTYAIRKSIHGSHITTRPRIRLM